MNQEKQIKVDLNGRSLPVKREHQPLRLKATPVADIYETHDTFVVALDLPGAAKDTIEVSVEQGLLVVRGQVLPRPDAQVRMVHREIGWNAYERSFKIGPGIDENGIRAEFSDGVLTIMLPKTEASRARQIRIS